MPQMRLPNLANMVTGSLRGVLPVLNIWDVITFLEAAFQPDKLTKRGLRTQPRQKSIQHYIAHRKISRIISNFILICIESRIVVLGFIFVTPKMTMVLASDAETEPWVR